MQLTSFSGQKLEKRFRKGPSVANRKNYMIMAPGSNHPLFEAGDPMYRTLHLENGESMERRGYIKISEIYSMNWRDAQPFWRGDPALRQKSRLDPASLRLLLFATQQLGHYTPGEQFVPSATSSRRSSSKSPVSDTTAAAAKAPQQQPPRRPSSLPERAKPLSLAIPAADNQSPPKTPQIARTTTTARTHPVRRRSPTLSLREDSRARVWDEERQPLITSQRNGSSVASEHAVQNDVSYSKWVLTGLKNAVTGTFRFVWFLLRFIARIVFR